MENSILNQCPFDPTYTILGLVTIMVLLLILVIVATAKLRKLNCKYDYFMRDKDAEALEDMIMDELDEFRDLRTEDRLNKDSIRAPNHSFRAPFQKYGIVKYNALKGMGGNLSFVLPMLDYTNSRSVMNCVYSREDCYLYVKEIDMDRTDIVLGNEEQEALEQALGYAKKNQSRVLQEFT